MVGQRTLFDEVKGLHGPLGPRLSGEPEVLHEIQDWMQGGEDGILCSRDQVKLVLSSVPTTFPDDWKSPEGFEELNEAQKAAYLQITQAGFMRLTGPQIQLIIEMGVDYRKRYGGVFPVGR